MQQSTYPNRSVIVLVRRRLEQRDTFRITVKVNPDVDCDKGQSTGAGGVDRAAATACGRRWHGLYSRAGGAIKRRKVKVSDANSQIGSGKMEMR
jgi:hypothetical protein